MVDLYFIAEIGQNHQGSLEIAKQMVDALDGSGVSAIKTAKRDIDTCLTDDQKRMPYTGPHSFGETYYEHRKALELSYNDFTELKEYVENKGFDFISSFTDAPSFFFLREIGVDKLKIASSRVVDMELLKTVDLNYKGVVYMSSGMSTIYDIEKMISILSKNEKYLLQCTSVYPCDNKLLHLSVLTLYKELFKHTVDGFGFSGHHAGIAPDIMAYFMGATVIERHFTLNRSWKGSDHAASLGVEGIKKIIKYIGECKDAIGAPEKYILPQEMPALDKLRGDLK